MNKVQRIKVSVSTTRLSDAEFSMRLIAAHDGLDGNNDFSKPPVDLTVFKATGESFAASAAEALGGGIKAIAERNRQRHIAMKMYEQLGHYVQANCDDDPAKLASTGFTAVTYARKGAAAAPLAQPVVAKLEQGTSGQLYVTVTTIPHALNYELRYSVLENDAPVGWKSMSLSKTRAVVDNLASRTNYAFQVRAFGRGGYTDWSNSATRICI